MRAWTTIVLLVLVGIVGALVGYWAGHFIGWSRDAEFPFRIGGGQGAILLSIGMSFLSVMAALWWLVARPLRRNRRLLANGTPEHATIVRVWRTGVTVGIGRHHRELGFELEVHPADGAVYTTRTIGLADPAEEAMYEPATEVNVRYDPSRPTWVAVEGPVAAPTG
jgi:hypothetical protein